MNTKLLNLKALVSIGLLISSSLFAVSSEAQFVGSIGQSSYTNESYSCRTYPGGEDIIIEKNGKSRTVSKKKGGDSVQRALKKIGNQMSKSKKTLKKQQKRMNSLLNSVKIALPKFAAEFEELRDVKIPETEARIASLSAQRSELLFIKTGVKNCGKVALVQTGTNQLYSATANGPVTSEQHYFLAARHVFSFSGSIPNRVCIELDGEIDSVAWTQNVCCTAFDGTGTSNQFSICVETGLNSNQAVVGLGGACGKFSSGRYEQDLADTQEALARSVRVFLPDDNGRCV